jgi:hypothetical protein
LSIGATANDIAKLIKKQRLDEQPHALPLSRERRCTDASNQLDASMPLVGCSGLLGGGHGCTLKA